MAERILKEEGDLRPLGKRWVEGFKRRNQNIKTLVGKRIDSTRIEGATPTIMTEYFNHLESVVHRLKIKPHNTYNMDETGTDLGAHVDSKVLGSAYKKTARVKALVYCE